MKRPLTTTQAARIASVHDETVRRWCEHYGLPHGRIGKMYAIDPDDLASFLSNRPAFEVSRQPQSKYTSDSTMVRDRQILPDDVVARNRQKIQELETAVMQGKVRPIYLGSASNQQCA